MKSKLPIFLLLAVGAFAQGRFAPGVKPFVAVDAPIVALQHVRVIDGTGAQPREDQTIVIDHGRIAAMGSAAGTPTPAGASTIHREVVSRTKGKPQVQLRRRVPVILRSPPRHVPRITRRILPPRRQA